MRGEDSSIVLLLVCLIPPKTLNITSPDTGDRKMFHSTAIISGIPDIPYGGVCSDESSPLAWLVF